MHDTLTVESWLLQTGTYPAACGCHPSSHAVTPALLLCNEIKRYKCQAVTTMVTTSTICRTTIVSNYGRTRKDYFLLVIIYALTQLICLTDMSLHYHLFALSRVARQRHGHCRDVRCDQNTKLTESFEQDVGPTGRVVR